ncbi:nuclear transport factor 2 family protein [Parapedomonas caeni]
MTDVPATADTALLADLAAVRAVVATYAEATRAGDIAALKRVFAPEALMSGHMGDAAMVGGPEPFYAFMADYRPTEAQRAAYGWEITHLAVAGRAAAATLVETNLAGLSFTDYFHLLKRDGVWRIIAKTFEPGL